MVFRLALLAAEPQTPSSSTQSVFSNPVKYALMAYFTQANFTDYTDFSIFMAKNTSLIQNAPDIPVTVCRVNTFGRFRLSCAASVCRVNTPCIQRLLCSYNPQFDCCRLCSFGVVVLNNVVEIIPVNAWAFFICVIAFVCEMKSRFNQCLA